MSSIVGRSSAGHTWDPLVVERLANGLTVVIKEDHTAPLAVTDVWFGVGSRQESEAQSGLAHFLEHVLFKGTATRGPGRIAAEIEAFGGRTNAGTSVDYTHYYIACESRQIGKALDIHADVFRHSTLAPEAIEAERSVILEEIKRAQDTPTRVLWDTLCAAVFAGHPYERPTLGRPETVRDTITPAAMREFFSAWYVPGNMVIVVVGDVRPAEIIDQVRALYDDLPARLPPAVALAAALPPSTRRVVRREMPVDRGYLQLAWKTVPHARFEEAIGLDLVGVVAGTGRTSRLSVALKEKTALVSQISAGQLTLVDDGLFLVRAEFDPGEEERVIAAIQAELARLRDEPIPAAELEKARDYLETLYLRSVETAEGKSEVLGNAAVRAALDEEKRVLELIRTYPAERVQELAQRFLNGEGHALAILGPAGRSSRAGAPTSGAAAAPTGAGAGAPASTQSASPSAAPVAASASAPATGAGPTSKSRSEASFPVAASASGQPAVGPAQAETPVQEPAAGSPPGPEIRTARLDNGLRVILAHVPGTGLVGACLAIDAGSRRDPPGRTGLSNLTGEMLLKGTARREGLRTLWDLESIGAEIGHAAEPDLLRLGLSAPARRAAEALEILADVTFGPTFPAAAFEIERRQVLARLRALPDNMFENTWRLFHETLYGSHPYGNHALGRVADVERLTPADLAAFHAEGFDPARMVLALVGDLDPDTALAEIERQFGGHRPPAPARDPAAHSFPAPTPPAACRRAHDRRRKAQAMVCLGWLGPGIGHPDYVPMKVLSAICGGGMGARLFQKVRNQAGLAYMAQAVFPTRLAGGPFCAIIGTDPGAVGRVCDLVLAEIDDLARSGPTEEERERAVAYLGGQFALDHAASLRQAHFLAWFERLGVGFGYDRQYPELLRAVTIADLQRVARTWLAPDRAVLAVTGPDQAAPGGPST